MRCIFPTFCTQCGSPWILNPKAICLVMTLHAPCWNKHCYSICWFDVTHLWLASTQCDVRCTHLLCFLECKSNETTKKKEGKLQLGQKYVDTWILPAYVTREHFSPKLLHQYAAGTLVVSGCLSHFGTWLQGFAAIRLQEYLWGLTVMLGDKAWLKVCVLTHPKVVGWGWGHGAVHAIQGLPYQCCLV